MTALFRSRDFFTLFPVPDFLLLSTSGIAISDDSIKYVEFKNGGGQNLELAHCGEVALAPGIVDAGFVHNADELVKSLSELKKQYGARYAKATLSEEKAYLFTTTIEKVVGGNITDLVAFILEENVPISLEDSVFDYEVIKEMPDGKNLKVAVSVLPKKVVETYTDAMERAGITPISFDIESQAIARAVVPYGDKRTHMIANIGPEKTGLYVVEDEVVQFSSTAPYGAKGDGSYPELKDLKSEIRKLLVFWNTRLDKEGIPDKKIEKIILCGAGSAKDGFVKELLSGIEIECQLADIWVNTVSLKKEIPKISYQKSLEYAAAVGLALHAKDKSHV